MAVNPQDFEQFTLRQIRITGNEFGRGSHAVVVEIEYRGLKCAGKKLYRVLYETGIGYAAQRHLEECRLLSQIRHPNIVQFLGVCFEEGSQFPILVMEFLPTNLTSCLERYGILPDEINFSILHDVSLGLVYLHNQTPVIVHRDLSANNVLLSTSMTAKISDLGVARILNLQVSQMTEAPGTPAYMPPEMMIADPHYDTSVDVFSFGIMMIHTFTAQWPLPKIGPNRIDPANPDRLIAVTEAERREEFLRKISPDHPLMDLIMRCLSNNPQRRPRAAEIVGQMVDVVLEYPPFFENRVEMLLLTENRELEEEIVRKDSAIEKKAIENEAVEMLQRVNALLTEKRELEEEIVRKNSAIEKKAIENEALAEDKRRQKEESKNAVERMQLAHVMKINKLKLEYASSGTTAHSNPDPKFNIVVYGIKESPNGTSRQNRMSYDSQEVFDVLETVDSAITVQSIRDCFRIGKYSNGKQRPILVKMSRSREVQSILAKRRSLPQKPSISIKPEMSFKERAVEKVLLKKRWELMGEGVEKETIKIKRKTLFVGNERHGFVNGSVYMLCNRTNDDENDENTPLVRPI